MTLEKFAGLVSKYACLPFSRIMFNSLLICFIVSIKAGLFLSVCQMYVASSVSNISKIT
mgnify:FL=1